MPSQPVEHLIAQSAFSPSYPLRVQVRYGTLGLLVSAMSALESVLRDCTAAAQDAAGSPAQQQGWLALRRWLQQAARQQLPDPTLLLALLAAAEKEGWETGVGPLRACLPACPWLAKLLHALAASLLILIVVFFTQPPSPIPT